jgi:hypothetical protein
MSKMNELRNMNGELHLTLNSRLDQLLQANGAQKFVEEHAQAVAQLAKAEPARAEVNGTERAVAPEKPR